MRHTKKNLIQSLQLAVFVVLYTLSAGSVYGLAVTLITLPDMPITIIVTMVYILVVIILGIYVYVFFSIPQKLPGRFDEIKNKIAAGELTTTEEFGKELGDFLIEFYDYSFFDVRYVAVDIKGNDTVFITDQIKDCLPWDQLNREAKESESVIRNRRVKVDGRRYYVNVMPIYFRAKYLGYFAILTTQRLGKYRLQILIDLENHYIDDQLFRLLPVDELKE